jgi:AAA+ superfamily predicted ATPase
MTTNKINELDYAMKRRISYFIEFTYAVKEQIQKMYSTFFPMNDFEEFYKKVKNKQFTINILEKFFVKYLFDDINKHADELNDFASGELKLESNLSMYS